MKIKELLHTVSRKPLVRFLFFFMLILILKANTLNDPFDWDGTMLGLAIDQVVSRNLEPMLIPEDIFMIHPMLLIYTLAVVAKFTGFSLMAMHMLILALAALGLHFMFILSNQLLKDETLALLSTLTLLAHPLHFSYSGLVFHTLPLITLNTMCFYFMFNRKYLLFSLTATIGALVKSIFVVIIPCALLWYLVDQKKQRTLRNLLLMLLPCLMLGIWVLLLKLFHPEYFFTFEGEAMVTLQLSWTLLYSVIGYVHWIFGHYFNYILLIPIAAYILVKRKKVEPEYVTFCGYFLTFAFIMVFIHKVTRHAAPLFPLLIIMFYASLKYFFSRWHVNIRKASLITAVILILLFMSQHHRGNIGKQDGLLDNMEYRDLMKTRQMAFTHIEAHYQHATILTVWPMTSMADTPNIGYTSRGYDVIEYTGSMNPENYDLIVLSSDQHYLRGPLLTTYVQEMSVQKNIELVQRFELKEHWTSVYSVVAKESE